MVISLIVLLIPIALLVVLFRLRGGEDVQVVDPSAALDEARAAAVFPVAEPTGLDSGWRMVSAQFDGGTLRIGYLTPSGGQVQLIEAKDAPDVLLPREFSAGARAGDNLSVDGLLWRVYQVTGVERALVLGQPDRTLIVIGRTDLVDLAVLAQAVT
jgi:hypothetical protein